MSVEVRRASQTHHVPQVGLPQIEPVVKTSKTKLIPIGAAAFYNIPEIFARQIMLIKPHMAMKMNIDSPIIADGTCI